MNQTEREKQQGKKYEKVRKRERKRAGGPSTLEIGACTGPSASCPTPEGCPAP